MGERNFRRRHIPDVGVEIRATGEESRSRPGYFDSATRPPPPLGVCSCVRVCVRISRVVSLRGFVRLKSTERGRAPTRRRSGPMPRVVTIERDPAAGWISHSCAMTATQRGG